MLVMSGVKKCSYSRCRNLIVDGNRKYCSSCSARLSEYGTLLKPEPLPPRRRRRLVEWRSCSYCKAPIRKSVVRCPFCRYKPI